jgi:putative ABC transport system permease protein
MNPDEARYAALRQFGNVARIQEECREQRSWVWLEQTWQDLNYAARQLMRAKGFTATVVVTLALGIGACTVVFTAINATLLHPMAGQAVDREVFIHETQPPQRPSMQLSPPMFVDLQRLSHSFELITAYASGSFTMQADTEPVMVRGAAVSPGLAEGWSPVPALGRHFTPEEHARGDRVIMLSYALWQRGFGGSPGVINRTISTDVGDYMVVGVISPQFARYGSDIDFWVPLVLTDQQRTQQRRGHYLQGNARLKRGVTLEQAQAELDVIAGDLARQYPDTNQGVGLLVRDAGAYINRSLAPMLYLLLGVVGCVLLIACANVANLLLARATSRQREMSIRMALGAGRGRLLRQLLVESLLLAVMGGAGGILLAEWAIRFLQIYGPTAGTDLARMAYLELDTGVMLFTAGFSLLTGIVFGLAPAWLASRVSHNEALKQGARGSSDGRVSAGMRTTLVIVEVALALVLLAGAGLLVRSFSKLTRLDPGFAVDRVATMQVQLNGRKYSSDESRRQFAAGLLERLHALPQVEAAALSNLSPFNNPGLLSFDIGGRPPGAHQPIAVSYFVTDRYFQTMGVRLIRGRTFTAVDLTSPALTLVVNETLVKQYFPNEDPIGRQLTLHFVSGPEATGEIVGVVGDVMQGTLGVPAPAQFYGPRLGGNGFNVMVRTSGDPAALLPLLKGQVYAIDKTQPVAGLRTMTAAMASVQARSQLMLALLGIFSLIALVIAAVGIYGVMAYSVGQRTVEFGIRMALGASRGDVLRQVLRRGMKVVSFGLLAGVVAALILGEVLQSLLYDTSPRDPVTLAVIVALLAAVAFLACLLPARRATKVDPMIALRAE